jgi:hypothetical protein
MDSQPVLLAAALAAAERGWRVFPLRPGTKKPALHGDSLRRPCPRTGVCAAGHRGWEQRATTDPARIHATWTRGPFNVGIATGPSGLLVVDLDTPKSPADVPPEGWNREGIRDGRDVFTAVCADLGHPVPWDTHTVATARGGLHLYYQAPESLQLRNTEGDHGSGLGWKVDTRGWGGYVVAAGSTTPDGHYRTLDQQTPIGLADWLADRLTPTPPPVTTAAPPPRGSERLSAYVASAVRGECQRVATAAPTRHSRTLFSAAGNLGQLVGAHLLPPVTAETELYAAARHLITGDCECTDREVRRTIANGLRAGGDRPRTLPPGGPGVAA